MPGMQNNFPESSKGCAPLGHTGLADPKEGRPTGERLNTLTLVGAAVFMVERKCCFEFVVKA